MRQKLIPQTVSFSEKEMIYREKLKKIGIEREAKRLTEFKIPF